MKLTRGINLFSEIKEIPAVLDQKTYPSLNGLRAISIIMVVICHFILLYNINLPSIDYIGSLGVNIFFVISGFLITTLCIKEKIATNTISLKKFYFRRILRILPVAYLYIAVVALVNYFCKLHMAIPSFIGAILFLTNVSYFRKTQFDWNIAHFWSLSVEEQFYLLLPFFIKKNFKIYVLIILVIPIMVPVIFCLQPYVRILNFELLSATLRYSIKFQAIAVGCLFSVLFFKNYLNWGKFQFPLTIISIFMIFYIKYNAEPHYISYFTNLAISIFTGILITNCIRPQKNLIFKFLNLKILNLIGVLSYSIYIWQQLFLSNDSRFPLSIYPVNLIFLIVVPYLSYFFYEKYFLTLKNKFKIKPANESASAG